MGSLRAGPRQGAGGRGALTDGDTGLDIAAQSLSISAASVGTSTDALDTDVGTLALSVTGAAYVNEANALSVSSASTGLFKIGRASCRERVSSPV